MFTALPNYSVNASARKPLVDFMTGSLERAGCRIVHQSSPNRAPFVITFETSTGETMGVVAYAFLATRTPTKNRPLDERSFQIKYGAKDLDNNSHELWIDPSGMFTTLLLGIDPDEGFVISADPVIHSPTKFFIRLEFKDDHADQILSRGWFAWERVKRRAAVHAHRIETLVGATRDNFLQLVRYERSARGLDPGNRLILAEGYASRLSGVGVKDAGASLTGLEKAHPLVKQFNLSPTEILDLIDSAKRLKMAVRGWVAEEHLRAALSTLPEVDCVRLDDEGGPDLRVTYRSGPPLTIECKNVSRDQDKFGNSKIDFQRTRAAKGDPCSRYYKHGDFDIVAACLHATTNSWDFRFVLPKQLPGHKSCTGRISNNVRVDGVWVAQAEEIFRSAYAAKGIVI